MEVASSPNLESLAAYVESPSQLQFASKNAVELAPTLSEVVAGARAVMAYEWFLKEV